MFTNNKFVLVSFDCRRGSRERSRLFEISVTSGEVAPLGESEIDQQGGVFIGKKFVGLARGGIGGFASTPACLPRLPVSTRQSQGRSSQLSLSPPNGTGSGGECGPAQSVLLASGRKEREIRNTQDEDVSGPRDEFEAS